MRTGILDKGIFSSITGLALLATTIALVISML